MTFSLHFQSLYTHKQIYKFHPMKTRIDPPSAVVGSDTRILCSRRYAPGSLVSAKGIYIIWEIEEIGSVQDLSRCKDIVGDIVYLGTTLHASHALHKTIMFKSEISRRKSSTIEDFCICSKISSGRTQDSRSKASPSSSPMLTTHSQA